MTDVILKTEGPTRHHGGVHALPGAGFGLRRGRIVANPRRGQTGGQGVVTSIAGVRTGADDAGAA